MVQIIKSHDKNIKIRPHVDDSPFTSSSAVKILKERKYLSKTKL